MIATKCERTGKIRYSRKDANKQSTWWRRRFLARMSPYECRHCGAWHIGNSPPLKARRTGKAHRR